MTYARIYDCFKSSVNHLRRDKEAVQVGSSGLGVASVLTSCASGSSLLSSVISGGVMAASVPLSLFIIEATGVFFHPQPSGPINFPFNSLSAGCTVMAMETFSSANLLFAMANCFADLDVSYLQFNIPLLIMFSMLGACICYRVAKEGDVMTVETKSSLARRS